MPVKILIIDDDRKLNGLLTDFLDPFGYRVLSATHPRDGLSRLEREKPELVILDIMLPELDGFEVCRRIRQTSRVPIIMLTARGELTDKVVGLELGADDYLAKPFEPRELAARIQSVLRRTRREPDLRTREFGPLLIDFAKHQVHIQDTPIRLTTNEFTVLALLAGSPGEVFDRDQILQKLKGLDSEAFNRTVDITISRLRQKLGDNPKEPRYIKTVWAAGYVFIGEESAAGHHEGESSIG